MQKTIDRIIFFHILIYIKMNIKIALLDFNDPATYKIKVLVNDLSIIKGNLVSPWTVYELIRNQHDMLHYRIRIEEKEDGVWISTIEKLILEEKKCWFSLGCEINCLSAMHRFFCLMEQITFFILYLLLIATKLSRYLN